MGVQNKNQNKTGHDRHHSRRSGKDALFLLHCLGMLCLQLLLWEEEHERNALGDQDEFMRILMILAAPTLGECCQKLGGREVYSLHFVSQKESMCFVSQFSDKLDFSCLVRA